MGLGQSLNWLDPDYAAVFRARLEARKRIAERPDALAWMKLHYRHNPADFIDDWGVAVDPRNIEIGLPAYLPFVLMPIQRQFIEWLLARWKASESGLAEKSRDLGASTLFMMLSTTLCIFHRNMMIGVGSAKEDKVDRSGDPDTLFYKARMFLENLPIEFKPRYESAHMRLVFPETGSSITGEAGENIGRGGRKAIFGIDESAVITAPMRVDAALIATTNCRIDISSIPMDGMANHFAVRRHSGRVKVFTMHYRDDLRKTPEWKTKKEAETDPVVWAAEYELNYTAAAEGVIIPQTWVQAAVNAHVKLDIKPSGARQGALDVADEGRDLNCFAAKHGIMVFHCEVWSGKGSDIFATTERAFMLSDEHRLEGWSYDADGLGAGVRGDATRIADRRKEERLPVRTITEYRGSAGVFEPDSKVSGTDRTNADFFQNTKSQSFWNLRSAFQQTFRAVNGDDYDPDNLISLSSDIPDLQKLCIELSQPQWKLSATGKMLVDKTPDGALSPNRADSLSQLWAPKRRPMIISDSVFDEEY